MKRIVTVLLVAVIATAAVSAQGMWGGAPGQGMWGAAPAAPQTLVKIEGKLTLFQGHPAVVVKDKTYLVQIPGMLYGFIDGLQEGATVKLEGYEQALPYAPNTLFFQVTKLTLAGKDYDLSQMGAFGGRGMMGGAGGHMGGRGMMNGRGW